MLVSPFNTKSKYFRKTYVKEQTEILSFQNNIFDTYPQHMSTNPCFLVMKETQRADTL